jgi:hypothetical protein
VRWLEPLIAQLVDDVLDAIRNASIDQLAEVRGEPLERPARPPPQRTREAPRARLRAPRKAREASEAPRDRPREPAAPTDITDPDWLLARSRREAPPSPPAAGSLLDDGPIDAGVPARTTIVVPKLGPGESVARATAAGLVIRRRKG